MIQHFDWTAFGLGVCVGGMVFGCLGVVLYAYLQGPSKGYTRNRSPKARG